MTLMEMVRSMMSYTYLPDSFQGYALEIIAYIINLVPPKSISPTPTELQTGHKPSLKHARIWGSPAPVLKENAGKLESRTKVCLFVGYPRRTKDDLFYCPKDKKVIVSINARFLEEDYMMNHKPSSRVIIEELRKDIHASSILQYKKIHHWQMAFHYLEVVGGLSLLVNDDPESGSKPAQHVTDDTHSQRVSHHSGRVYDNLIDTCSWESLLIIPDEQDTNPATTMR